jgi:hypothetical protein
MLGLDLAFHGVAALRYLLRPTKPFCITCEWPLSIGTQTEASFVNRLDGLVCHLRRNLVPPSIVSNVHKASPWKAPPMY